FARTSDLSGARSGSKSRREIKRRRSKSPARRGTIYIYEEQRAAISSDAEIRWRRCAARVFDLVGGITAYLDPDAFSGLSGEPGDARAACVSELAGGGARISSCELG